MLFFTGLDEPIQQKILEKSNMPETKHDLVTFAMKLQSNLDCEPKPSLSTCTRLTPSTPAQLERNDAPVASSSHEEGRKKEIFCSYCGKNDRKEAQCRKKSYDAKKRKKTKPNTA